MLGFAIVGCGRISKKHAELLVGKEVEEAELVAVCDVDADRAAEMGGKYGVPQFTDMHEMMNALGAEIDVVCILTPSGLHAQHVVELASYGKHLVVEKPMALNMRDADKMIQACDKAGVKLFVVKQNRYNRPVQQLRKALEAGRLGRLIMGTVRVRWCRTQAYYDQDAWRGTWALDGGVFANQASHHVDLLMWSLGEPVKVYAVSRTALVDIEAEDTGIAVIQFASGALGIVEATTATRPKDLEGSLSIMGEKGSVEIGGFAVNEMKVWNLIDEAGEQKIDIADASELPPNVYGFGHKAYLNHVCDVILHNKPLLVDGVEGRRSLELISAIYESIETGREVALPFTPRHARLGRKA
jgi:UDP-N-acetyl-2-amino-2-deoxyglucuronate dehydrogenase